MTQAGRMLLSTAGADPILDDLVEAFADKLQKGEPIDPEAYAQEHPERGEELRRILPSMLVLADLARSTGHLFPARGSEQNDKGPIPEAASAESRAQPEVLFNIQVFRSTCGVEPEVGKFLIDLSLFPPATRQSG